jgi:hypothetical protein
MDARSGGRGFTREAMQANQPVVDLVNEIATRRGRNPRPGGAARLLATLVP